MISLASYKELLGNDGLHLTDAEVKVLYDSQYQMAELAFQIWAKEHRLTNRDTSTIPLKPQV